MAEYKLRIQSKCDTIENWTLHGTFVPLSGEICVYSNAVAKDVSGTTVYEPRLKVGDGVTPISDLPYASEFEIVANPTLSGGEAILTALDVNGTNYKVEQPINVVANPTVAGTETVLSALEVGSTKYRIELPINVVANPTLVGTEASLTGIEIGSTKYSVLPSVSSGDSGKVLSVDNNGKWGVTTPASPGMSNPMTTEGDIIVAGSSGTPDRLAKGTTGQVLTMNNAGTFPEWKTLPTEMFKCTYGTTTYAQITQALSDGKLPVCFYNDIEYIYVGLSSTNRYTFASQLFDTNRYVSVNSSDSWGVGSNNFEITSNKVTSISSSSTDSQYPSAKCVYDNLGLKMSNPMTTAGDIIVGGSSGTPDRLSKGTDGQVLKMVSGSPTWDTDTSGMANPMTTKDDIIIGGSSGSPTRLAVGSEGQVLKVGSSGLEWATDTSGMSNPMTTAGDIIVAGSSGTPTRLAKGTDGQVLKMSSGSVTWGTDSGGMTNPMTAEGDIIVGASSGTPSRLAKGSAYQFLVMNSSGTSPEWRTIPNASDNSF